MRKTSLDIFEVTIFIMMCTVFMFILPILIPIEFWMRRRERKVFENQRKNQRWKPD